MAARALLVALVACALAAPVAAGAATIPVNTTSDEINADGDCSLREAVQAANTNAAVDGCTPGAAGLDSIELSPARYTLSLGAPGEDANQEGDLDVAESLVIEGAGSGSVCTAVASTCIDAGDLDRALDVRDGADPVALALRGLTISDGRLVGAAGGAVSSQQPDAVLSLDRASILSSQAGDGGAISSLGAVTASSSLLGGNEAIGTGGAIAQGGGSLQLSSSVLRDNRALGDGGAIAATGTAAAALNSVTLARNEATAGEGGAIAYGGSGDLAVTASSLEDNLALSGGGLATTRPAAIDASTFEANRATGSCLDAGGDGGAIYDTSPASAALGVTNSTISGNAAGCRGGGLSLFGSAASTTLIHVTIAGNSAASGGGGVDNEADAGGSSTVTLRGSILAYNGPNDCGGDGPRQTAGFNISGGGTCGLETVNGDLVNTDPVLGPLRYNGGPTRTRLPLTISPALNAVGLGCPGPASDQRGITRPVAGRCDIGSVEAAPAPLCAASGASIAGTPGDDKIFGTEGSDVIAGLGGNDLIIGLGGNDLVCAGAGDDFVFGGKGSDRLRGEPGRDRLFGNAGNDLLEGGLGKDKLKGGRGKNKLKQ